VVFYLAFAVLHPSLVEWSTAHRILAQLVFLGFPPWPWLSAAAIGLVLGWLWLDARERGQRAEVRYFLIAAIVGVVCVVAYFVWEALIPTSPMRFGFRRDFILNTHWTPRGMTAVLVAGGVALSLAAAYYVMEVKKVALPWLVVLGQTALMLYFAHQVIELTILGHAFGLRFTSWPLYWLVNAVFVVVLVYLGKAWLEMKRLARTRGVPLIALRRS
jgi:cation transport ATPase